MTDTEAIALRANSATKRHKESPVSGSYHACHECGHRWPCDAASLAADIPELLARVREFEAIETAAAVLVSVTAAVMPEHATCHHDKRWLLSVLSDLSDALAARAKP